MFSPIIQRGNLLTQSKMWFPRQFGYTMFQDFPEWKEKALKVCNKLIAEDPTVQLSGAFSWQSRAYVHQSAAFKPFMDKIDEAVDCTLKHEFLIDNKAVCTGAWVNKSNAGEYMRIHTHSWSHISVVLYLDAPPYSGDIFFSEGGDMGLLSEYVRPTETAMDKGLVSAFRVTPADGLMLIFPSTVPHEVLPGDNITPRVSFAANYNFQ